MRALRCMIRKEFLQLRRDPALLRIVLLMPIVQLLVLAYALNNDLRDLRVGVLDEDHTPLSRSIVDAFPHSDTFAPGPRADGPADLDRLLRRGACDLALHIPPNFARDVAAGRSPAVGVVIDGTNSSIAGRGAGYAESIILREASRAAGDGAARPPLSAAVRFFYNPELETRLYMVPGIIVMLVTIISALVTGMAVVREKEIGTLEQVMVTPLSSFGFIAGKTLPFALIALVDLALATAFAMAWFHVPMTGSPAVLLIGVLCYLLVTLGLGLLASAVSDTQQQAMFTVWFFLVFAILLSGFFFPVQNMPAWARALTWLNPMRFFMSIVRGVLLRGAGFADLAPDLLVLLAMGAAAFGGAVAMFRRSTA
jgi:drug efflux transport system permease protein